MEKHWHLFHVKENKEDRVGSWLTSKKIEYFSASNRVFEKSVLRSGWTESPLLPGQIFVKSDKNELAGIVSNRYVINAVYWKNRPVIISECTMNTLKNFLKRYQEIKVQKMGIGVEPFKAASIIVMEREAKIFLPELGYLLTSVLEKDTYWMNYNPETATIAQETRFIVNKSARYMNEK
ncbi:MAG: hypothetical protein J0H55_07305 [Chitinophagaceae bacterium]|nr:hypothetical protein [Chitinophagaceae bacterium]